MAVKRWPEGPICSGCFAKARETYGRCSTCDTDRMLPGISASGQGLCTDCAGGLGDFTCTRCGQEGWLHYAGICGRCVLTDRLTTFLDDGTSSIRPELQPLFASICAMSRPRSGILWLSKPHVPPILQALAKGNVPLTHEGLSRLTPWRSVVHVRDLLISCGILPPIDRYLFLFEQWLPTWLDTITDPEHRKLLHRFSTWHILRRLRTTAQTGPIGHYRNQNARCQLRAAAAFLAHLSTRGHDAQQCTQTDLDSWFATANSTGRQDVRSFLRWATEHHTMARLTVPASFTDNPAPISNQQRIDLIRRIHTDPAIAPIDRVIALLILLYAQPLPRIVRLTLADISRDGEQLLIRLGDPPVPVPEPFAEHITTYVASRPNLTTATNPDSQLLFPGRRAGQPIHPTSVRLRLQNLGIPNLNARTRAIRELLLQAPAPVVATMLNYTSQRAERIAAEAGNTWKTYAAGDHTRRPNPTPDRR
ncbi:hypothetical protein E1263_13025 [Kribbella antibiotica]|uniref:Recombinase XerD n=1 Tax=Kribbella antibiotica TaxID=190195 RepID=A0A4R4ZMI1_9ACTN|nr:hypothetical protein [Kribbella antibiotica]TDD60013.1 hypothetical protein E1263_13025 [Kribbella antibiotica]